jgi:hypothetical protein
VFFDVLQGDFCVSVVGFINSEWDFCASEGGIVDSEGDFAISEWKSVDSRAGCGENQWKSNKGAGVALYDSITEPAPKH